MPRAPRTIGVIGSGPVGRGIATLLQRAGYEVTLGTGHPQAPALSELPSAVVVGSFADAADAEAVFIAVAHGAALNVLQPLRNQLAGKVVVDTMNAWIARDYEAAGLSDTLTEGSWLTSVLPGTKVARAFSHIDWDLLVPNATKQPGVWAAAFAASDDDTIDIVEQLIRATGYIPVNVGTLDESAPLDVGGVLWPRMLTPTEMRGVLDGRT